MSADATLWSSEAWASAPDAYLLQRTREGSPEAFGELWRRHLPAAYAVAGRHRGRSAPEDIVAEAAARVLALIRDGRGPDENFRAYFLSAVRTVAIDQGRRDLRVVPTEADDLEELTEPHEDAFALIAVDEEGVALVRQAFAGLSERDQRVLWHTTVEGAAPRAVAPALGMTANAVSVRAMRARESLRALYLDARAERGLAGADTDECRWTVSHLGALVRGRLPKRQTERAEAHVAGCPHAAAIADDLRLLHDGFPALLVPLVLAAGLGTPGFVGVAAFAGLSGSVGASAGAPSGASAGAGGSATSGPSGSTGASSASSSTGASGAGAIAEVASQVTALVAGLAVTAGVAGALALPSASLAAPRAAPAPTVSSTSPTGPGSQWPGPGSPGAPSRSAGATSRPGETSSASVVPPASALTGTPSAAPAPASDVPTTPPADATVRPDGTPAGRSGGTAGTGGAVSPSATQPPTPPVPAGTSQSDPPPPPPPPPSPTPTTTPTTTPPTPQPGGSAPTVTVRLVSAGDPARISVRVRSEVTGTLTIRIGNASGSGELTVRNSSWSCAQAGASAVRCSGTRGQALLDQTGTGGVEPVVVRVTDATGRTWTETLRPT